MLRPIYIKFLTAAQGIFYMGKTPSFFSGDMVAELLTEIVNTRSDKHEKRKGLKIQ